MIRVRLYLLIYRYLFIGIWWMDVLVYVGFEDFVFIIMIDVSIFEIL